MSSSSNSKTNIQKKSKKRKKRKKPNSISSSTTTSAVIRQKQNSNRTPEHDHYVTPLHIWKQFQHMIPKDNQVYWMPFYANGECRESLESLGYKVVHAKPQDDFFEIEEVPEGVTAIYDNPPFSSKKQVLQKIKEFNIPFALFLPFRTKYFRELFNNKEDMKHVRIIIPKKRLEFTAINQTKRAKKEGQNRSIVDVALITYKFPLIIQNEYEKGNQIIYLQ